MAADKLQYYETSFDAQIITRVDGEAESCWTYIETDADNEPIYQEIKESKEGRTLKRLKGTLRKLIGQKKS